MPLGSSIYSLSLITKTGYGKFKLCSKESHKNNERNWKQNSLKKETYYSHGNIGKNKGKKLKEKL